MLLLISLATVIMLLNLSIQLGVVISTAAYWVRLKRIGVLGVNYLRDSWVLGFGLIKLMAAHLLQIALWAVGFMICGEFDRFETAFYHSAVNFASLGYGDIVMSEDWRLLGALEATVGVMMFGISAALLFAGMRELIGSHLRRAGEISED